MADGTDRPLTVEPIGDTGFSLGAGLYFGFDGHWHGEWRGRLHVDGEHLADCSDPEVARRVHQHRDCVVRVDDPIGGGTGVGEHADAGVRRASRHGPDRRASFV